MPSPQPNPNQQTKCGAQKATQVRIFVIEGYYMMYLRMVVKSTKEEVLSVFFQANQHHPTVQVISHLGQHS